MTPNRNRQFCGLALVALLYFTQCPALSAAEFRFSAEQLPITLGQYLDHFEDETGSLAIEQIISLDLPWQRSLQSVPTMGMTRSSHWFHLVLTGAPGLETQLAFMVDSPSLDIVEMVFVRDGQIIHESVAGDTIPFSQWQQPFRVPVFPFPSRLTNESVDIYFRIQSAAGVEFPLILSTLSDLLTAQQTTLNFFGAFFALFFACSLFSGILYFLIRDQQYSGYGMFFSGALLFFLCQTGMGRVWFWGESPEINSRLAYVGVSIILASLAILGQAYNPLVKYRDAINTVLRFVALLMVPLAIYFVAIPFESITAANVLPVMILAAVITTFVLVLIGMSALRGSRAAIYLFASALLTIIAYLLLLAYKLVLFERPLFSAYISESMMLVAALLLVASLAEIVRSKNDQLSEARLESQAKADFLKNVSREFLTPVHLILANSKRLIATQRNSLEEPMQKHVQTVIKQSDHLHNLINDLLEMAELESDSFEPEIELVEMTHFINEIANMMTPTAMEKGLSIKTDSSSTNLLAQTDRSRLQHILINLITNAIKYSDSGTITLGYKATYFRRRLGIEIFVSDEGRGMSAEFQDQLFTEFAREGSTQGDDQPGTGLSLVIVKRMVEKLGGEIRYSPEKSRGSRFAIRLPLRTQGQ